MDTGAGRHVTSALRIVTRRLIDLCRLRSRVTLVVLLNLICVIWIGLFCRPPRVQNPSKIHAIFKIGIPRCAA